jgi:copper(I)-binding protein
LEIQQGKAVMRHAPPPLLFALLLASACAKTGEAPKAAAEPCAGDGPVVTEAWVRATPSGQGTTAAYFTVCNAGSEAVELVGIDTPAADIVELHETKRDESGVASMAPIAGVTLAPKESLSFTPGGKHVMLIGVHDGLAEGATAQLTLHFSDGSTAVVQAPVKTQAAEEHPH